ncbi:hypothetical protein [Pedobacter xixiisoli]|uniref:Uncharacterized protein n=1 Tax=Pedobacter xixiisoli TaxID=1476464 RepID=A0A286A6Y2_9SPHI|nr:hypothetical protein [Pedobacter xixiisoli]SOD17649.1 hypothetical protein SAMN06297358_2618 [Pedobacter xixiisoli]
MDKKTTGSWLIHHTNKLQGITSQEDFKNTFLAGKSGILLSAISANAQMSVNKERLEVLAKAANISTMFELPKLLEVLKNQGLIDISANGGISVYGVTTAVTLQHTADIFDALEPSANESASIALAERASISPVLTTDIREEISDTFKLSSSDTAQLLLQAEKIGFVDAENISKDDKLLFNGNLFRRDTTKKVMSVMDSLKADEKAQLVELSEILKASACVPVDHAKTLLGKTLFEKVTAIGLYDISIVSNSKEEVGYLTLPSAFSKFSNSMIDDAFDLAKAFVSSITYGMTKSSYVRGQIQMVDQLLSALVRGESVGPVQAIAEDYKVLELKGVVQVHTGTKKGRTGPMLKLLKKEVGELALQAIRQGDVSEHSLTSLPTAAVTTFNGPETNREVSRRTQAANNPKATNEMLSILRTGGGI